MIKKIIVVVSFLLILFCFFKTNVEKNEFIFTDNEIIDISDVENDIYINKIYDYKIKMFPDMKIDESLASIRTRLYNDNIQIDIFFDDFRNSDDSYKNYTGYGNRFLENEKYHKLTEDKNVIIDGYKARLIKFEREKLHRLENDKNYYCTLEVSVSEKIVYTILVKSSSIISDSVMELLNSFKIGNTINKYKIPDGYFENNNLSVDKKTEEMYKKYFIESKNLTWGIFDNDYLSGINYLDVIEDYINYEFKFLITYHSLGDDLNLIIDEIRLANNKKNKIVMLTLQTMNTSNDEIEIYEILNGKYDTYLNEYAKRIKELNIPILFRLNNEMNGDWCEYSAFYYAKDTDLYKEAWKYLHNIFEDNGADNVLWVWNTNNEDLPNFSWNDALLYYPGDEYVDIVGLTAYNTGTYYEGEEWKSFKELYFEYYAEYSRIFSKPLMISEFGCAVMGGYKPYWVNDMFEELKNMSNIKVAIWWNGVDYDSHGNESRVYRIDRPRQTLVEFKKNLDMNLK